MNSFRKFLPILLLASALFSPQVALGQKVGLDNPVPVGQPKSQYNTNDPRNDAAAFKYTDLYKLFGLVIAYLMGVIGTVSLAAFVYGGFLYLSSGGGGRVKEGTEVLKYAAMGVVFSLLGYVIMRTIINFVTIKPT